MSAIAHNTYKITFNATNEAQDTAICRAFTNFSWGQGLAVETVLANEKMGDAYVLHFTSSKGYCVEGSNCGQKLEQGEANICNALLGKEQFFSSLFYEGLGLETLTVTLIDPNGFTWQVTVSKYSDLVGPI